MCKKLVYKTGRILSYRNLAKECKMVSVIDNTYVIPKNFQQNEDYGNSDNIKANPFMNSFFICWNSEKCQWLEFRSLRFLCYSLAGPFRRPKKIKIRSFGFFFFFFFWARVYIRAFHIGLFRASASRWRLNENSFLCFDSGLWVFIAWDFFFFLRCKHGT